MGSILPGRHTADFDGPLVVFVIGLRINRVLRPDKWLPVARAMGPMIAELAGNPDSGYLGSEFMMKGLRTVVMLQYWRDFERLEAYARDRDAKHWPAWADFNRKIGSDGSVGIFHETYVVPAQGHETIYANMPRFGLGRVAPLIPATGSRNAARERMRGGN